MENVVVKPLGRVLEQAGLISNFQIHTALKIQSHNHQVKFGTILVKQGILKQKTVDFFAEQWPQLLQQQKTQPLGYYFQEAALLDPQQLEALLKEQQQIEMLLGELAVEKGLLRIKTLNFFLEHLVNTDNKQKLLSPSQQEIIKSLHLETKSASPYSLLKEVFEWTGGHPLLTRRLCQVISDADYFIPSGMEATLVEKLVQERVIYNWTNQAIGEYLKTIQEHLLNNTVCLPKMLLEMYLQILQQGEITSDRSQEKKELIKLGLIIEQENKLKVSNRIYQSIFNSDWVKQQLLALEEKSSTRANKIEKITPKKQTISKVIQNKNEPLTQIAALISALGLLIISPLVVFFNNSQHKVTLENDSLDFLSLSKSTLCTEPIPTEKAILQDWRIRLEQAKQKLPEHFPESCQSNLDKLIVLNALELGKENRVLDGINDLCQIGAMSESFNQAQFWLSRWYNSAYWGEQTQSYLRSINDCPAAEKFTNN
ncbi:MAG: hypothetical protein QNJ41_25950 [Xenococcaceae cyanobacterium MO_188.B32]|nr:hypothetical protein [Xenococcaceae cyanobacterium MO_188.B32]